MNRLSLSANPSLEMLCSQYWLNWLKEQNLSIALSTYQTNRLFLIGLKPDGTLSTFERLFERAMGLYAVEDGLLLATRYQIWQLDNLLSLDKLHQGNYDRLYTPAIGYTTGDLNTHELAIDSSGKIIFVNTKYSCLAKLKRGYSFEPVWQPNFISDLVAEDRCHLNGMAMVAGKPKYVTACSRSDVVAGWRLRRDGGGIVIDVESNEIIARGLSMPHSPRWYRDKLWLNNSGTGEFGYLDLDAGKFEPVVFCPGFVRGLAFHDNYAIVGMSKSRDRHFSGLPLDEKLAQKDAVARCGVMVIDLDRGKIAHWIELEGVVKELFDVVVLPGVRQPMALGFKTDEIERLIVFPEGTNRESPADKDSVETFRETSPQVYEEKNEIKLYFDLGRQEKKAGNLISAIASFRKVIQLQPDNFAAYNNLGNIFQSQGETDKAIAAWQKASLLKPDNAFIHNNLGQVWQLQEKPELALEAYKKAIAVKPDYALAYLNLGKLLHQQGAIKRAEQCYQRVLEFEPNNSEAHFSYGNLLKNQERLEEAISAYRLAVKHQPDFTAAYLNLGGVLQKRGANDVAKKCYQKVLKLEPDNNIAISNLAEVYCYSLVNTEDKITAKIKADCQGDSTRYGIVKTDTDREIKIKNEIKYQILNSPDLNTICQMDAITYPSMKRYWSYRQQQGRLVGILASNDTENVGLIIAEIALDPSSIEQAKILSFFVQPQNRRQGIGSGLMRSLEEYLQSTQCQQIVIDYQATELSKQALEPILARQNWRSPKTTFALFQTNIDKIAQAPWLYKYSLPNSFTVFPWTELTKSEKAELAQRSDYPPSLSPLTEDPRLEPLNSLGLRYQGKVVGWCLTHRINRDTIRYSTMYVEPKFQKLGRGISLVAEAIKRQINNKDIPNGKWSIAAENQAMLRFGQRHLVLYCSLVSESRCASKMAEIEGSCDEVQPVAKTFLQYAFQYLNYSDQLDPIFRLINKFSKCISFTAFDS